MQYINNNSQDLQIIDIYKQIKRLNKQEQNILINLSLDNKFLDKIKQEIKFTILCLLAHIKYKPEKNEKIVCNTSFKTINMEYNGTFFDRINFNKIFNNV